MRNDFAIFILTHGRANNVITLKSMEQAGYDGRYYLIVDNEDDQVDIYRQNFGVDKVIVFDKEEVLRKIDTGDNFHKKGVILYARNACFDIAKELGLKYFLELDDDYTCFSYRFIDPVLNILKEIYSKQLNRIINMMIYFLESTGALTVALAQNGDFIGGIGSRWEKGILRKAMNSFFCKTENRVNFVGTLNEDVNMYTSYGLRGNLIMSITLFSLHQLQTQTNKGGMTDAYHDDGTYVKSFYSILYSPSCVKVAFMNTANKRIHHKVSWEHCAPKIIRQEYKKVMSHA